MMLDGRLVQVYRVKRTRSYMAEWMRLDTRATFEAGERPEYMTLTYEQDAQLRRAWGA